MSIMTMLFGNKPVEQAALPNQQTLPGAAQKTEQTDVNGVVPEQKKEPVSPLDEHKSLWQTPENKEIKPNPEDELTPEKMFEAAGKVDFSRILDANEVAKIENGGKDALSAVVNLLNQTARATYGQSMVAAKKMVDTAVADAQSKFSSKVPDLLRNQTAKAELYKDNPSLNNPVLAPIIEAIQSQLALHKPEASAAELKDMSMKILQSSANLINPPSSSDKNSSSDNKGSKKGSNKQDEDWLSWIEADSSKSN